MKSETTPKRWLEQSSDATSFERELLSAVNSVAPPASAEAAIFEQLATRLDVASSAGGAGAVKADASHAAVRSFTWKFLLGGGLLLGGGAALVTLNADAPGQTLRPFGAQISAASAVQNDSAAYLDEVASEAALSSAPVKSLPAIEPTALRDGARLRNVRAPSIPARKPSVQSASVALADDATPVSTEPAGQLDRPEDDDRSSLKEESQLLARARSALHSGDAAQAFALLSAAGRRFPSGILSQEREALVVEALFRSGNARLASSRAERFIARFPSSPHAARLRGFVTQ